MKIVRKLLLISTFALIPLGAAYFVAKRTNVFLVQTPEVFVDVADSRYLQVISQDLIEDVKKFGNQHIWKVDVSSLNTLLSSQKWIKSHHIQRHLPNSIKVEVRPKSIATLYLTRQGKAVPIAYDGSLLPEVEARDAPNVPVIRDVRFLKDIEARMKLVHFLEELPSSGPFSRASVAEIAYENADRFLVSLVQSGVRVRIGTEDVPLKVGRVSRVLEYLQSKDFEARVIDADYSKKVLVKLRHRR